MNRLFFHVDMDAFFAAVEQRDDPSLVGKPVIVGAKPGMRGVVATCSYEARAFGVHSAMPISEAVRRCPGAAFIRPRMERYCEISSMIEDAFRSLTSDVRMVSIDEAFLDMTGTERLWGDAQSAARRLKALVLQRTGLTLTVGGAANRYVAKIASSVFKPDGLTIVPAGEEAPFMRRIPLAKLWGAGDAMQRRFKELGFTTVGQLADIGEAALRDMLGEAAGSFFFRAARGEDPGAFEGARSVRSMSVETTFESDVGDAETLRGTLLSMAMQLSTRLLAEAKRSNVACLKLRTGDFRTTTTRHTAAGALDTCDAIYQAALAALDRAWDGGTPIRLIGLALDRLADSGDPEQLRLFDDGSEKMRRVEKAVFELGKKGVGKVVRARMIAIDEKRKPGD